MTKAALVLHMQDAADQASCRCAQCAERRAGTAPQGALTITAEEVTLRVYAEFKSGDTYVMAGKRCIEQKNHRDEAEALAYLARVWGLRPKKKAPRKKPPSKATA
jgi:hypothetical protein